MLAKIISAGAKKGTEQNLRKRYDIKSLEHNMTISSTSKRRPVPQIIADELLARISDGEYQPGDMLPTEAELASQFGVSKPALRESLQRLAALGVVSIVHGQRAVVSLPGAGALRCYVDLNVAIDPCGMREAVEFRAGLETECVLLAAQRASQADIALLEHLVRQLSLHRADADNWAPQHAKFHLALVRASANRFYISMHEALNKTILLTSRHLHAAQPERDADATFQRHLAIFEAVRSGDGARAQAAMAHHFTVAATILARGMPDHSLHPNKELS